MRDWTLLSGFGHEYCQCVVLVDKEGGGGLMSEKWDSFK